ncbi:MAG: alpha/beta hydrolase [Anaerolineales bacterium]|nr:alpha/beta hydrolase [Anaerolineales bacterium]
MKRQEISWKADNGLDIFAQVWQADDAAPRGVVCLTHGLGEHSSRYAHVAEAFVNDGYAFCAFDLPGHGRSGGARGHISSIEDFLQNIDRLLAEAKKRYPDLPIVLYGHSLGGILVLNYALKRKPNVKGVIATSSGLRTALEEQPLKIFMAKLLGSLAPTVTLPSGLEVEAISRDEAVVQAYKSDPLVHDKMSLGFGKIMLGVIQWTLANVSEFPLPLLLMHGKSDRIAYPSGSIEVAEALGQRATLVLWEGGYHELHNDLQKEEVLKTMLDWANARAQE